MQGTLGVPSAGRDELTGGMRIVRREVGSSGSATACVVWAAVNAYPHKEQLAAVNLERQGFQTYCPLIQKRVRHARRIDDVRRPLFPGYLFVRMDQPLQRWRPIASTLGVRALVMAGDQPGLLADEFIQSLKSREVNGVIVKPEHPYCVGQAVTVLGGPFDGLVTRIVAMDDRNRLVVLMGLLGRTLQVSLDSHRVCASHS